MKASYPIIIIDDDDADHYIAKRVIKKLLPDADILIFTEAGKGLEFIKTEYTKANAAPAILFLDINMPDMSGWEFMERFEKLDDDVKKLFTIYLLTSSMNDIDRGRAKADKNITDYLEKPLTEQNMLPVIFNRIKKKFSAKPENHNH